MTVVRHESGAIIAYWFLPHPSDFLHSHVLDREIGMTPYLSTGLGVAPLSGSMHAAHVRLLSANVLLQRHAIRRRKITSPTKQASSKDEIRGEKP